MKAIFLTIAIATIMSGCSITEPVVGQLQSTDESFTGTATGGWDGAGELRVVSSKGTVCAGKYVFTSSREGSGVFNCDDKRSGPFTFSSTGTRGVGVGTLAGERFTFSFGE